MRLNKRKSEDGNETVVVLFWLPILFVLLVGLVDVGVMFGNRAAINDVLRDSARGMAAYGADCPTPDPIPGNIECFSRQAEQRLYSDGSCTFGFCTSRPRVTCSAEDGSTTVKYARTVVTCEVDGKYPYRAVSAGLLNSPIGLGLGGLVGPFPASASAVAEVGSEGVIGIR